MVSTVDANVTKITSTTQVNYSTNVQNGLYLFQQWWRIRDAKLTQPVFSLEPLSAHRRNAIQMAFHRWADDDPILYANWVNFPD